MSLTQLTDVLVRGAYAERLRQAADLLDGGCRTDRDVTEVRAMLYAQRVALIASDVSRGLYEALRAHLKLAADDPEVKT